MLRRSLLVGSCVLIALLAAPRAHTQTAFDGGGEPDKGSITLTAYPTKAFVGETVTQTAELTAPEEKVNGEIQNKSVEGIQINFSHVTTTIVNPTNSDGKAIVEWVPDQPGEYKVTASVPSELANDYSPNEDEETITVVGGSVALTVEKDGKDVDAVAAGQTVTLHARLQSYASGQTIEFTCERYDDSSQSWVDEGSPWPMTATTDSQGEASVDTPALAAARYRFTAWYDSNGDGSKDQDETDSDECIGIHVELVRSRNTIAPRTMGPKVGPGGSVYAPETWIEVKAQPVLDSSTLNKILKDVKVIVSHMDYTDSYHPSADDIEISECFPSSGTYFVELWPFMEPSTHRTPSAVTVHLVPQIKKTACGDEVEIKINSFFDFFTSNHRDSDYAAAHATTHDERLFLITWVKWKYAKVRRQHRSVEFHHL